jgi:hypothetical protein
MSWNLEGDVTKWHGIRLAGIGSRIALTDSPAYGTNTLYTVPTGKRFILMNALFTVAQASINAIAALRLYDASGVQCYSLGILSPLVGDDSNVAQVFPLGFPMEEGEYIEVFLTSGLTSCRYSVLGYEIDATYEE